MWSISDPSFSTGRSSVGCSDVFLTAARRAEALATTESTASEENSSLGEEALQTTLRFKKASSPGRFDRELTPCSRARGGGVGAAPESRLSCSRVSCAIAAAATVFGSALLTSAMSRCIYRRRLLRRSVVAVAFSNARCVRAASAAELREPSRASRPRDESSRWRAAELGELRH